MAGQGNIYRSVCLFFNVFKVSVAWDKPTGEATSFLLQQDLSVAILLYNGQKGRCVTPGAGGRDPKLRVRGTVLGALVLVRLCWVCGSRGADARSSICMPFQIIQIILALN